jgi:hypothetical protein
VDAWRKSAEMAVDGRPSSILADDSMHTGGANDSPMISGPEGLGHTRAPTLKQKRRVLLLGSGELFPLGPLYFMTRGAF